MPDGHPRHPRRLESLRKEARRWRDVLRAHDADARALLERAIPGAPASPTLRDVQHALAREHGLAGWPALKQALEHAAAERRAAETNALAYYETAAGALLEAYRTGTPEAMERHYRHTWHRRAWPAMRTYVQLDLGKRPAAAGEDVEISIDEARYLVAIEHGFPNWNALVVFTQSAEATRRLAANPVRLADDRLAEPLATTRDWDEILRLLAACHGLTNAGVARLARLPRLCELRVAGRGLTGDVAAAFPPAVRVWYEARGFALTV